MEHRSAESQCAFGSGAFGAGCTCRQTGGCLRGSFGNGAQCQTKKENPGRCRLWNHLLQHHGLLISHNRRSHQSLLWRLHRLVPLRHLDGHSAAWAQPAEALENHRRSCVSQRYPSLRPSRATRVAASNLIYCLGLKKRPNTSIRSSSRPNWGKQPGMSDIMMRPELAHRSICRGFG